MRAVAFGTLADVQYFVHKNPKTLFAVDEKGRTGLDWARMCRKLDVVAFLTQKIIGYINIARTEEMGLPTADGTVVARANASQVGNYLK
jgi:hypothetical protein